MGPLRQPAAPPRLFLAGLRRRHRLQKRRAARVHDLRAAADAMAAATTPEAALQAHEHLVAVCVGDEVFAGEAAWPRLARIGVPALVVASAQALHAQLDGARYGGAPVPPAEIRKIAEALFAHCASAGD